jgi:hypothetical protein
MVNVSIPAYGPQLKEILSASTLCEFMISGGTQSMVGHGGVPPVPDVDVEVEDDEPEDGAGDGVGVAAAAHAAFVMVFPCKIISVLLAKARPVNVAPVLIVIDEYARMFPRNDVVVSRTALLPIPHHILQGSPPVTEEPGDVVRPDTVLKIQTPDPVRVIVPVRRKVPPEQ